MQASNQHERKAWIEREVAVLKRWTFEQVTTNDMPYDFDSLCEEFNDRFDPKYLHELLSELKRSCRPEPKDAYEEDECDDD